MRGKHFTGEGGFFGGKISKHLIFIFKVFMYAVSYYEVIIRLTVHFFSHKMPESAKMLFQVLMHVFPHISLAGHFGHTMWSLALFSTHTISVSCARYQI